MKINYWFVRQYGALVLILKFVYFIEKELHLSNSLLHIVMVSLSLIDSFNGHNTLLIEFINYPFK